MKRLIVLSILLMLVSDAAAVAAVRGDEAKYVGGTLSAIPEKTEGRLDTSGEKTAKFVWKKGETEIPFDKISSIEYGQKAGRRIGMAVAVSPLFLLSKKRKHYVTIGFTDSAGKQQGGVFELGKGKVRGILTTLENRSGKKVDFESEEAKKNLGN